MTAVQRPLDLLDAIQLTPCGACRLAGNTNDDASRSCLEHGESSAAATIVLPVLRSIVAAYVTGHADCWEAGFQFAEHHLSPAHAPLLVGHVAALVRLLRQHRDPLCLPSSCNRLSADEKAILAVIAAPPHGEHAAAARALLTFGAVDRHALAQRAAAIRDIAALQCTDTAALHHPA